MADEPTPNPEDEFRRMLERFLGADGQIDPDKLAGAAGLPQDPEMVRQLLAQLQGALSNTGDGVDWKVAREGARQLAAAEQTQVTAAASAPLDQAFQVAALWLDEVTYVSQLTVAPRLITRAQWTELTMPVWTQLAEPVALSIADSLTEVLQQNAPEEMQGMVAGAGRMMRNLGGTLFAMQLGQVVGQLSTEVVSGGDVGIPLLDDQQAALLPQNVQAFGEGIDVSDDQVQIYLAVRELAHARLFRHARWLRLQLITSITEFAKGVHIDTDRLESLAEGFDPSNPEELRQAMVDGSLIPPKTDAQLAALARLETMLALIEGWVDVVTAAATVRLPRASAIAETVRRRRATGGPAESAFATLVGLELRPRRLREAAAMWQAVSDGVGAEQRDALWSHPDVLPTSEDIDAPHALVARLTQGAPEPDEVDQALEELLSGSDAGRPVEDGQGRATEPGETPGDGPDDASGTDPRPV
ncbi:zinc-dependent metalloprotease [Clavibacter michiganensis subsp. phaseoli]|uniref:zinc-dependent metalloprotease n=1 Tax=Clavibacter phaseoli TaxID=1734031 RepID=UPI001FB332A4|nr:zinc-dependent metalloprotease [Clavibacter phaseoli]MCJ1710636.1 zinc-dependent metalloprotease [Clavibacter phaseoli]